MQSEVWGECFDPFADITDSPTESDLTQIVGLLLPEGANETVSDVFWRELSEEMLTALLDRVQSEKG